VEQFAGGLTKGRVAILPFQVVAEDVFISTVRPRRIVNCSFLTAPCRNIRTYLLTVRMACMCTAPRLNFVCVICVCVCVCVRRSGGRAVSIRTAAKTRRDRAEAKRTSVPVARLLQQVQRHSTLARLGLSVIRGFRVWIGWQWDTCQAVASQPVNEAGLTPGAPNF